MKAKNALLFSCFKSEIVNKTKLNSFNSKYRARAIRIRSISVESQESACEICIYYRAYGKVDKCVSNSH